jgi:hypothetical protein
MKTVGDYKKAGLVFVEGDSNRTICGSVHLSPLGEDGASFMNSERKDLNHDNSYIPTEFAWRTNTGEKPSFDGLIEYRKVDCKEERMVHSEAINWESENIEWRPSLNQGDELDSMANASRDGEATPVIYGRMQEPYPRLSASIDAVNKLSEVDKPTYTKAMQEAGESIKSGQQFIREGFDIVSNKVFYVGAHPLDEHLHVVWEVTNLNEYAASYALPMTEILPIQTEREKQCEISVKNAENILIAEGVIKYDPLMLEILFYKGLLK